MTSAEHRKLSAALRRYREGDSDAVVREVCGLLRVEMPEVAARTISITLPPKRDNYWSAPTPQPKPERHVDEAARRAWTKDHPSCEVCGRPGVCHHIWPRGIGGPDEEWNFLTLCDWCPDSHHALWHRLEPEPDAFLARFAVELGPANLAKIAGARARQLQHAKGLRADAQPLPSRAPNP